MNKRHYEHTLPNIRGSLSNTYIKAIDANMYLYLFVENIAPIQEIDTANCIHFKLNSVVLNIHIDKKDNAKTNIIAFNIYFSFILL